MNCNYTILPNPLCLKAYFHIEFTNFLRVTVDDFVEFRWNGNVDLNVTSKQMSIINRYYSPPSNMTLQFHSGPSPNSITSEMQQWHFKLTSIVTPIFVRKTLDQTTPKYVQWLADMGENDALTVCILNGTLELLFTGDENTNLSEFLLYDSNDVNNFVGSLNSFLRASNPWLPARIQSTSKCFTLYVPLKSYAKSYTALFRIVEYSNLNCRGANNVFQVPYTYTYPPEYDVSVQSTTLGSCEMIILSSTGYFSNDLPHIWIKNISADSHSMYLFKSGINDKKLMNLNGSEASQWQSFGIYTSALIIVLPPSATITLHLSYYFLPREQINILKNGTQKGIMVSPSYCGFLKSFGNSSLYSSDNVISQISLNLDVKNIYGTLFPLLEYGIGQRLTINQSTNISSTGFNLYFNDNGKSKDNGFLIKYTIKPMVYDFDPTKTKPSEAAKRTAMGFIILIIITVIFLV
uniref:CUB-like domain-containing protein n=1 Tax=Panagrolaimus superbus TaxID=310955 RepID=A0A914XVK9_9BILA